MFGANHQFPKLCWLSSEGAGSQPADEQTWMVKHQHVSIGSKTPITLTIGNKRYALSSVAEPSGNDAKSKYPSEATLYKKYSTLFPYNNHFFAMSAKDLTLHYAPKNGIVLDIYSAWAVLGKDPAQTAAAVTRDARLVSTQWNAKFSSAQTWKKRSHKTRYALIGENSITKTIRSLGKETTAIIKTQLLLTVSNYHFNVEAAKTNKDITCTPSDCKVSIKFSSDDFIPKTATDIDRRAYHFDKNAFCVSYSAFMSLLADQTLKDQIWPEALQNYKESTGVDLESHDSVQEIYFAAPIDLPPAREEVEEIDGRGGKKGGGKSKSSSSTSGKRASKRIRYQDDDDDDDDNSDVTASKEHYPPSPSLQTQPFPTSDDDEAEFARPDLEIKIGGRRKQ